MTDAFDYPETGLSLPEAADRSSAWLVEYGLDAVDAGFESVWCSEGWGYNPFQLLARIGERTDATLGTAIANVYARSPGALASNALTMQDLTDGRFVLGIGASTPTLVEGLHGRPFRRPVRRLRETIEIVDLALSGQPVDYDGELFDLAGLRLNHASGDPVPVFNAAMGRTNVAMSIDHADGIVPHLLPFDAISDVIDDAEARAHGTSDLHVAATVPTSVADDAAEAERVLARHVAYYAGASEAYNGAIASNGFPEVAAEIRDAWTSGDRAAATKAVTDDLLAAVGVAGTPADANARLEELIAGDTLDTVIVSLPRDADEAAARAALDAFPGA